MKLRRNIARVFQPLLAPSRYKAAHGGRGSGKSHFFAEQLVEDHLVNPGLRSLSLREVQKSLKQSSKKLIEDKIQSLGVGSYFNVLADSIQCPGDGIINFVGMQDHTAESVKSFENYGRAWLEEAQAFSERSVSLLRPTIRVPNSEIWASWNPRSKRDAIDNFFRGGEPPPNCIRVQANWSDNPWFTSELYAERQLDLIKYPERYAHIWDGAYATALEGAYFARQLAEAKNAGRISCVSRDPLLPVRAIFDLGGAGANADAMSIWLAQWVGLQIRVLDYIEGQGQVLAYYVDALRSAGYGSALCILPHDGLNSNAITGKTTKGHLEDAGFEVDVIPNQGAGAAMQRIRAAQRLFPQIWFNEETTEAGREALGFYHEKRDETRNVGLGPEHDWSSHGADAFGLMCVAYEEPRKLQSTLTIPAFGAV